MTEKKPPGAEDGTEAHAPETTAITEPLTSTTVPTGTHEGDPEGTAGLANPRGPIAWMAQNSVAANLLMFFILAGGVAGALRIKQEVFPEFTIDVVRVTVPYPGASPDEVEQGIILVTEEAVRGVDGVKRVTSVAGENSGTVAIELLIDADPDKVLNDIKGAVDRITSYPLLAERPTVKLVSARREVISLIIAGDQDLRTLQALGEQARNGILEDSRVTQVELFGVPPVEISIELKQEELEKYGLSAQQVARTVAFSSLELPGGEIETSGGELLVRVSDRAVKTSQFEEIVLKTTPQGASIRLRDVASIRDGFADTDQANAYNGRRAVRVTAYRVGDETPVDVADAVKEFAEAFKEEVGDQIEIATWADQSEILKARIDLLVNNAWMGLILVLVVLALFLNLRLAFWVAMGIPTSFMGAFLLLPAFDLSVNMVSLFAFIITLGLVVDDAIVVGEHAYHKMQEGMAPMRAAIEGTREMAVPVTFAVLTTVAAFSPLLLVPGFSGKIFRFVPLVVIAVLLFSVIEGFFVLPAHLGHTANPWFLRPFAWLVKPLVWPLEKANPKVALFLDWFIERVYQPVVRVAVAWKWATLAWAVASLLLAVGLVGSGLVPFQFFPSLEGDQVRASVRLPYGAPEALSRAVKDQLEAGALEALKEFGGESQMRGMYTRLGETPPRGGPGGGATETGSHLVSVEVNLIPSEQRSFASETFATAWREATGPIVGAQAVLFDATSGPGAGAAVDVQLTSSSNDQLAKASEEVADKLREYSQLTNIENTYASGKPQLDFRLKPEARALGLTANDLALQLRSAFFGAEALREQRGRSEMKVMVRLSDAQRNSEFDLEQFRVLTPSGARVPLGYVAEFERGQAPTAITREEGLRIINVQARLAAGAASARPVLEDLQANVLPPLMEKYPGLKASFVGAQREQAETLGSLGSNFLLAMLVIYFLLAVPLRSYTHPLVIMSAIPFGFVGAVMGHLVMGYEMSVISMMGMVALAGVVVNDSLVLIDAVNTRRREGYPPVESVVWAGMRRLRPILLTSLTTFFGLMPMIFEKDLQARFLIPMALSLGFGVLFATFISLVVVPAVYLIIEDIKGVFLSEEDLHA